MTTALSGAVELLDRSLAYTGAALARVTDDRLDAPTPCTRWDLGALLRHMDDALDAFTEAATGAVSLVPTARAGSPETIRAKACALLGWWCAHPPEVVRLGDATLTSDLLVGTAALEITVHGWDVHRSVGTGRQVPEALARDLLPLARAGVTDADRPVRFAAALATGPGASDGERLLALLGRA